MSRCWTRRRSWPCSTRSWTRRFRSSRSPTSASSAASPTTRRGSASPRPTPVARRPSPSSMLIRDALDKAGLRRCPHRARAVPALDDRLDHRARPPAAARLRNRAADARQRRRNVRNAAPAIPSRSAGSARRHARRSGGATPAWSRSTASSATRTAEPAERRSRASARPYSRRRHAACAASRCTSAVS